MRPRRHVSNAALVKAIAILARRIAGDVAGFGDLGGARSRSSLGARARLLTACRELLRLERELGRLRKAHVQEQTRRIAASTLSTDRKVHIGGGGEKLKGWIDVDLPPGADLPLNVLWGLPFASGCVSFVFCSHMLEHLDYPADALAFLREIRRVLRPGGVARFVVPDIEKYFAAYVRNDKAFFRARRKTWPHATGLPTLLTEALLYAGGGAQPDDFFGHKFGYDFETLRRALRDAGFRRIVKSGYMKSRRLELRVDSASPYARAAFRGRHYSLFVDATR